MSELLSVIVPVYNEANTIGPVIDRLISIPLPVAREIIVINDGSRDGTRAVLDGYGARLPDLTILHQEINRGKGAAVRLGFSRARGSIVAIQDADLELDPAQLGDLVAPILARECAVVYGSRFLTGSSSAPWLTRVANRALTATTNVLFGADLTDMETCYKVMRTEIARGLPLTANRFDIEPEITAELLLARHRIVERPVTFSPRSRAAGKKIGWGDGVTALRTLARIRFASGRRRRP
jgi:glycosyltransferase involved in cell wall biosynthesis